MSDKSRDMVRSFLIGSLLGDTYASGTSYQWCWGNIDRGYVEWKAGFIRKHLGLPARVNAVQGQSCRDGVIYCFSAANRKGRLRIYRNWFYDPSGRKCITRRIRHLDHPLGLVVLILDQGSCRGGVTMDHKTGNYYYRKPSIRIHLNAYSEPELIMFQAAMLENFGLDTTLQRKSKGYLDVYFNTRQTQSLWQLLQPWMPEIDFARRKFHPLINQTTNAHLVKRHRGVEIT
jgi:hypothetical protein